MIYNSKKNVFELTEKELCELIRSKHELQALENYNVDMWSHYEEARKDYTDDMLSLVRNEINKLKG